MNALARFYSKTKFVAATGCLVWTGAVTASTGYGKFSFDGRAQDSHRVAWQMAHGPIPARMMICHTCDNRVCVQLHHLFLGSRADNMRDAARKGRLDLSRVRAHLAPKLSDDDVREIDRRYAAGELRAVLALEFGVAPQTVSKIALRDRERYQRLLGEVA